MRAYREMLTIGPERAQQAEGQAVAGPHVQRAGGCAQLHQGGEPPQHRQGHCHWLCVEEEQRFLQGFLQETSAVRGPHPQTRSLQLQELPHLAQRRGSCGQVPGVLVSHGRQPATVSLLQEAFSAQHAGSVATETSLILQHKRVLGAQAEEAAQQPAARAELH